MGRKGDVAITHGELQKLFQAYLAVSSFNKLTETVRAAPPGTSRGCCLARSLTIMLLLAEFVQHDSHLQRSGVDPLTIVAATNHSGCMDVNTGLAGTTYAFDPLSNWLAQMLAVLPLKEMGALCAAAVPAAPAAPSLPLTTTWYRKRTALPRYEGGSLVGNRHLAAAAAAGVTAATSGGGDDNNTHSTVEQRVAAAYMLHVQLFFQYAVCHPRVCPPTLPLITAG